MNPPPTHNETLVLLRAIVELSPLFHASNPRAELTLVVLLERATETLARFDMLPHLTQQDLFPDGHS